MEDAGRGRRDAGGVVEGFVFGGGAVGGAVGAFSRVSTSLGGVELSGREPPATASGPSRTRSTVPGWMVADGPRSLSARMCATGKSCMREMAERVSPGATVCAMARRGEGTRRRSPG